MYVLGEPLAVELANTVVERDDGPCELLDGTDALQAWLEAQADQLPHRAREAPPRLADVRRLRTAIGDLLGAALDGTTPDAAAVDAVNAASDAAPSRPRLVWDRKGARVAAAGPPSAKETLAAIARSAIDLVTGPDAGRLRRCDGPGCVLLFVATNPRRRWCSDAICGNRVRVARHYQRHQRS